MKDKWKKVCLLERKGGGRKRGADTETEREKTELDR